MLVEICVDSVESAKNAKKAGADRIELCQALDIGGLTPSYGLFKKTRQELDLEILVMLRPRSGDFLYSDYEKEVILEDAKKFMELGADGLVVGALRPDGKIDEDFIRKLRQLSKNKLLSFHRAFDMSLDLEDSLESLVELRVDRILTSGGRDSLEEATDRMNSLMKRSGGRIELIGAAGINTGNIEFILANCQPDALHFSAKKPEPSQMIYRNKLSMGRTSLDEYVNYYTDPREARSIIEKINLLGG